MPPHTEVDLLEKIEGMSSAGAQKWLVIGKRKDLDRYAFAQLRDGKPQFHVLFGEKAHIESQHGVAMLDETRCNDLRSACEAEIEKNGDFVSNWDWDWT